MMDRWVPNQTEHVSPVKGMGAADSCCCGLLARHSWPGALPLMMMMVMMMMMMTMMTTTMVWWW